MASTGTTGAPASEAAASGAAEDPVVARQRRLAEWKARQAAAAAVPEPAVAPQQPPAVRPAADAADDAEAKKAARLKRLREWAGSKADTPSSSILPQEEASSSTRAEGLAVAMAKPRSLLSKNDGGAFVVDDEDDDLNLRGGGGPRRPRLDAERFFGDLGAPALLAVNDAAASTVDEGLLEPLEPTFVRRNAAATSARRAAVAIASALQQREPGPSDDPPLSTSGVFSSTEPAAEDEAAPVISLAEILGASSPLRGDDDHHDDHDDDNDGDADMQGRTAQRTDGDVALVRASDAASSEVADSQVADANDDDNDEDEDDDDAKLFAGEEWSDKPQKDVLEQLRERTARRTMPAINHSTMQYAAFRKKFYIEPPEITALPEEQMQSERAEMRIRVRGRGWPRHVQTWTQCGLTADIMRVLDKEGYTAPFSIQKQAIPIIMSGRDVIGVASTGSGKTLAFLIPLIRHVADQPPLTDNETGPIAIVLSPTRELAVQTYLEAKKFAKALDLSVAPVYGGANIGDQIAAVKRGVHILVGTPGRTIDLLSLNGGRVLNLHRTTFVVLDEADRMFDLGFEPQIRKILEGIRPNRQTVMFSATFPQHIESLARSVLQAPVEIVVGGRSVSNADVAQFVEVRNESSKFPRLLQLLGAWWERGAVLVFVDTKEHCDELLMQLLRAGYSGMSLHGGKEQEERSSTIADFKKGACNLMVATSVACRGLDVRRLALVVNFSCPNHLEDYVQRIGRTGRAGRKGTAFTFITPEEAQYAGDLVKALRDSAQTVPPELLKLAEEHEAKVRSGEARRHASGYVTKRGIASGDQDAEDEAALEGLLQKHRWEHQQGIIDTDDLLALEDEIEAKLNQLRDARKEHDAERRREWESHSHPSKPAAGHDPSHSAPAAVTAPQPAPDGRRVALLRAQVEAKKAAFATGRLTREEVEAAQEALRQAEQELQSSMAAAAAAAAAALPSAAPSTGSVSSSGLTDFARARAIGAAAALRMRDIGQRPSSSSSSSSSASLPAGAIAAAMAAAASLGGAAASGGDIAAPVFELELDINDYPQQARKRVLSREVESSIIEMFSCAVTARGVFVPPGRKAPPGEKRLTLHIEGPSQLAVRRAQAELRRVLEEVTSTVGFDRTADVYGKFSVAS